MVDTTHVDFVRQMRSWATLQAQAMESGERMKDVYIARGYGAGGANEITAEEYAAAGISKVWGDEIAVTVLSALEWAGTVVAPNPAPKEVFNKTRMDL